MGFRRRVARCTLSAKPEKPPPWWPMDKEGDVCLKRDGGWTTVAGAGEAIPAREVKDVIELFLEDMSDSGLDFGKWDIQKIAL